MYHSKQKSPTAFSSASLPGFQMRSMRFAQQWLFPLEISKQVTQNISPHQGTDGPERLCPAPPRIPPLCLRARTPFQPPGANSTCPSDAVAGLLSSSPQPHPVPAMGPTKPLVGPHPNPASVCPQGGAQCRGLGLPPVPPSCPAAAWGGGMGPSAPGSLT